MIKQFVGLMILAGVLVGCGAAEEAVTEQLENAAETIVEESETVVEDTQAETVAEDTEVEVVQVEPTSVPPTAIPPTAVPPTAVPPTEVPAQAAVAYNAPAWTSVQLVNAATGESFTLADFAGKTVFVEPMATWCSNCRSQQARVAEAMAQLNPDDFVFISMSVEVGLPDANLATYAERNGFPQLFTVAPGDLLAQLTDQFGRTITSPPSTPHFIISPTGTVSGLSTGSKSPADIVSQVTTVAQS